LERWNGHPELIGLPKSRVIAAENFAKRNIAPGLDWALGIVTLPQVIIFAP